MLFPKIFYGPYKDVKQRCIDLVEDVPSLEAYCARVLSMGMVDTATTRGVFLIGSPGRLLRNTTCFRLHLLVDMIDMKCLAGQDLLDAIFREHLTTAWGTLLLASSGPYDFNTRDDRPCALLEAFFTHWEEICSIGPRFSYGLGSEKELLARSTMLDFSLYYSTHCPVEMLSAKRAELFHELRAKWALGQRVARLRE